MSGLMSVIVTVSCAYAGNAVIQIMAAARAAVLAIKAASRRDALAEAALLAETLSA